MVSIPRRAVNTTEAATIFQDRTDRTAVVLEPHLPSLLNPLSPECALSELHEQVCHLASICFMLVFFLG